MHRFKLYCLGAGEGIVGGVFAIIGLVLIAGLVGMVEFAIKIATDSSEKLVVFDNFLLIICVIGVPLSIHLVWYSAKLYYQETKKKTTCPKCKEPFVFERHSDGSKTLGEQIITRDVKDENGKYRRKAFRVGEQKNYYKRTCKKCGHTQLYGYTSSYNREIK